MTGNPFNTVLDNMCLDNVGCPLCAVENKQDSLVALVPCKKWHNICFFTSDVQRYHKLCNVKFCLNLVVSQARRVSLLAGLTGNNGASGLQLSLKLVYM